MMDVAFSWLLLSQTSVVENVCRIFLNLSAYIFVWQRKYDVTLFDTIFDASVYKLLSNICKIGTIVVRETRFAVPDGFVYRLYLE